MKPDVQGLANRIAAWQRDHGRHHLPWQADQDAYRIWLSEIMLQQTQVATVIPYFEKFVGRFPDVHTLAQASLDDVMVHWAGLGYYRRARYLHQCAQEVVKRWNGVFPSTVTALASLPGIGPSTAAAIAAQAYGVRAPILDGNVKRVLSRLFAIDGPMHRRATEKRLWEHAQALLDAADHPLDMRAYTQGLMDLGATICKRHQPQCSICPLSTSCRANALGMQDQLPQRAVRKSIPQRACVMLILTDGQHVLLVRQPESGLWSNLWSLPQFDHQRTLLRTLKEISPGHNLKPAHNLPAFDHTFSHFRLSVRPVVATWSQTAPPCEQLDGLTTAWRPIQQLPETALPAPVEKLLFDYFELSPVALRLAADGNDGYS